MARHLALAILIAGVAAFQPGGAYAQQSCTYTVYWWNDLGASSTCGPPTHPHATLKEVHQTTYCCEDGTIRADVIPYLEPICTDPGGIPTPNGTVVGNCDYPITPGCECGPAEEQCDREAVPPDPRCNNSCANREYDESPVRYIGGSVQSQVHAVFSIAGNGVLDLGFAIQYRSRSTRRPADSTANNSTEDQHFVGWSWEDSYSDRLIVPSNAADPSVWSSLEETVAFSSGGHSTDGRFELTDHGAGQVPRWTIASRAANSPHRTWEFFDSTPSSAGDPPFRRGLLHAKTGAGFRVDIERVSTTDTRIVAVVDSLGRRLAFFYLTTAGEPTPPGGQTPWTWQLDHVTYTPAVGQQATLVASFAYDDSRRLVEVERAADYLRFNYLIPVPAPCAQCLALLTEVIQPRHAFGAIPARQTPPQPHEQVLEGHAFEIVDGAPRAVESWSPTTHWAYRYEPLQTVQIDLLLPKAVCTGAGTCPAGQACHATPQDPIGRCYVANVRPITDGRIGGVEHGGKPDEDEEYVYSLDAWHTPKATVARGVITSYTFDSQTGEPRCIVRNDDDYEAELDDPQQVEGDCYSGAAGPVQIVKPLTQPASNGGQTTSVTTTSVFQPAGTTTTRTTFDVSGLVSSVERLGWTQDLDATPGQQTRTTTRDYDNLGRLVRVDGPAENSEAMDVVEYTYHEGTNLDRGRLRYERRYVGTAGSHTIWETEYSEYDVAGVPHRIEAPDGLVTTLATGDGLNWEVIEDADDEQVVSYVSINPDGSRHHAIDADGVCITQEVDLAANRMITRRSPSNPPPGATSLCGVLPIDINFGEVLIVEHAPGDPSRVVKLEARRDGVVTKSVTGFQYDDGRRLVGAEGVGGIGDFETAYVDALEAGTTSPLWPAAGSWRTQVDADALARPTELRRYVGATSAQKTRLLYDTAWDGTPNRIERGLDSTVAQSAQFIYDDFGQIVETTSPDSGVTRWQYDAIGQRTHQRLGVGTADQRTDRTYYDVLGRIVRIDHDLEHPVDCATAGDGTPIADEEYDYDVCDPSAPQDFCLHTLGRLTSARRQIECGGGAPFSLVRRFKYDRRGRLMQSQSNDAGDIVYEWTPAGRLTSELPTGSFGTTTTYSPTGAIDALAQIEDGQPPVQIVGDVSHAPFAGLTGYQVFGALTLQRAHRLDGALERHAWLDTNDGWLDERLTYNPSGLVTAVEDAHAPARSRWYDYDHLLRLTCEREADPHDLASCDPENAQVRELFTYHDGASTLSPPDHRDTSLVRTSDAAEPVSGTATYPTASNAVASIDRGSDTLVIEYDSVGRRVADYEASDPTGSLRTYEYLPDGHLWRVTHEGQTLTLGYGLGGSLISVEDSGGAQQEHLAHDDFGRVITALVGPDALRNDEQRWSLHYLGSQLVAATNKETGRYAYIYDHRGLIVGVVDEDKDVHFTARYNAFGLREEVTESGEAWVPFALPGQHVLTATRTANRGPLHANGARVYDPDLGIFLSPDPADAIGRINPEGYAYGRNNPLTFADPTGASAESVWEPLGANSWFGLNKSYFVSSCSDADRASLVNAIRSAVDRVAKCSFGDCGPLSGSVFHAMWLYALSTGTHICGRDNEYNQVGPFWYRVSDGLIDYGGTAWALTDSDPAIWGRHGRARKGTAFDRETLYAPLAFYDNGQFEKKQNCLARTVAHEALHVALTSVRPAEFLDAMVQPYAPTLHSLLALAARRKVPITEFSAQEWGFAADPKWDDGLEDDPKRPVGEAYVRTLAYQCVTCP